MRGRGGNGNVRSVVQDPGVSMEEVRLGKSAHLSEYVDYHLPHP